MLSNKRHFAYNLLSSYGNTIISSVLSFISVPIALNYWGSELYGIWTILTSFATYITASGLGIDSATGNLMLKNPDLNTKVSILRKGVKLLFFCSLFAAVLIVITTLIFPDWFRIIGKMDEVNYPVAKISAMIFIAGIIINMPLSAISNSLASFGKAYIGTIIGTIQTIAAFCIILITVNIKLSLPFYVLLIQCNTIVFSLFKLIIVIFTVKKIRFSDHIQDKEVINSEDNHYLSILKMGINMSLYGLALMLIPNISNLVISNNINVKTLVPYSLSYKLFSLITTFVANANLAMSPILGQEYGKKNWEWLKNCYNRMFCTTVSLSLFFVLGVIWLSRPFIRLWTGSFDNCAGNFITILLGLFFFIGTMSTINHVIINTFNYTNKVWIISWTDGFVFLLSSIILIKKLGVISVPLGLLLGAILVSSWAYPFLIYKRTERRFRYDFKYLLKNLIIFLISILAFLIISNLKISFIVQTFFEIIGMSITTIILFLFPPKEFRQNLISKILKNKRKI